MECLLDVFTETVRLLKYSISKISVRDLIIEKLAYKKDYFIPKQRKVLVLGSGGLSIGQAGEFDYSGAQVKL